MVGGSAGIYTDRASTAPLTRPTNEFVVGYGMFTAVEFALMARRHMITFGTTPEQMAAVARSSATTGTPTRGRLRRTGSLHAGGHLGLPPHRRALPSTGLLDHLRRGLRTGADHRRSGRRPPTAGERGSSAAAAMPTAPPTSTAPSGTSPVARVRTSRPATWDGPAARRLRHRRALPLRRRRLQALYDPFSFNDPAARSLQLLPGRGGRALRGRRGHRPRWPVPGDHRRRDHVVRPSRQLHPDAPRVIRGVQQVRGTCRSAQVAGAGVALCSNGGSGALFNDVLLVGRARP